MVKSEFYRFLLAGGVAATANFGSRFFFSIYFEYTASIFLAYLVGMLVAFMLMRSKVFNAQNYALSRQIFLFLGINVLAMLQTLLVSILFASWLLPLLGVGESTEAIAHFIGVTVPILTSYFGHKYLTFR